MGDEARQALSRYALDRPRILGSLPASARNENLLVEDAWGARYVLRRYRRNPSRARIAWQLSFQEHLFGRGIPTSRVVHDRGGEFFLDGCRHFWALFSYVSGAVFEYPNPIQVGESARWLAQFHVTGEDFAGREVLDDTIPDVRRWWLQGEAELHQLHVMFDGRGVARELAFLERWRRRLVNDLPLAVLDGLPRSWVHGDYQSRNLVFRGERMVGLFDFDAAHRGSRIEDLALALGSFGREGPGSDRIDATRATIFLGEYRRGGDLTDWEIRALPMMLLTVHARNAARYALRESGGEDAASALRAHVRRMAALTNQLALIRTLCDHAV